jgi:uncharacterized protein (DUF169 family)
MKSKIENYLNPDLNPVAITWSNDKPEKALQYKEGKYACFMHLVAQAARGKTAVLDADTSGCVTAASAFGFGTFEDKWLLYMDYMPIRSHKKIIPRQYSVLLMSTLATTLSGQSERIS